MKPSAVFIWNWVKSANSTSALMRFTGPGIPASSKRSVSPIGVSVAPAVAEPVDIWVKPIWGTSIGTNCWHCGVLTAWNLDFSVRERNTYRMVLDRLQAIGWEEAAPLDFLVPSGADSATGFLQQGMSGDAPLSHTFYGRYRPTACRFGMRVTGQDNLCPSNKLPYGPCISPGE